MNQGQSASDGNAESNQTQADQTEVVETKASAAADGDTTDNLRFVTEFVDENTDIDQLMAQNFPGQKFSGQEKRNFGIVGLHTCGSLATSSIKIFLAKEGARYEKLLLWVMKW